MKSARIQASAIIALSLAMIFGAFQVNSAFDVQAVTNQSTSPSIKVDAVLLCFNSESSTVRSSTQSAGCTADESSLGATKLSPSSSDATNLNPTLKTRFLAAQAVALSENYKLSISSGFRTRARQAQLFKNAVKKYGSENEASKWVLPPEYSHHPMGLAIDVNLPNGQAAALWLQQNGHKFGLCRVYENEWWHFEPVIAPGEFCPPRKKDAREDLPTK